MEDNQKNIENQDLSEIIQNADLDTLPQQQQNIIDTPMEQE